MNEDELRNLVRARVSGQRPLTSDIDNSEIVKRAIRERRDVFFEVVWTSPQAEDIFRKMRAELPNIEDRETAALLMRDMVHLYLHFTRYRITIENVLSDEKSENNQKPENKT